MFHAWKNNAQSLEFTTLKTITYKLLTVLSVMLLGQVRADWPQFQGPNRDSHSPETGLLKQWPEGGPKLNWTFKDCGLGYSSAAIVGDRLYISGARGEQELLICLDAAKGKELWTCAIGPKFNFDGNSWGPGPRATPTVGDGRVFALGGFGNLVCVDAASGKLLWSKEMMKDLGGEVNPIGGGPGGKPGEAKTGWGYTWSPLLAGDQLICVPGGPQGAVAALDTKSGDVIWRSKELTAQAAYASPIAATIDGVPQYIVLHNGGLVGVSAKDGSLLWTFEKEYPDVAIPTPIYHDGHLFASACASAAMVKLTKSGDKFEVEPMYKGKATRTLKNQVGGSVLVDGHLYGYSEKMGWVCQEMLSGDQAWAARSPLKAGSVVAADGMLIVYDEDAAEVALVKANPEKFELVSKFALPAATAQKSPGGRNWTPPVINNGQLLIRDQELLFSFQIK